MSRVIGVDIGTTTLCACVLDGETGALLAAETLANRGNMQPQDAGAHLQRPDVILDDACALYERLVREHGPIAGVGITGQMHGIVYVNKAGEPCSPLATWQDGRGNLPMRGGGESYAERLARIGGHAAASGYGIVTHFYNVLNNQAPPEAATFCTIQDALAMRLSGRSAPLVHASNAASFGMFDLVAGAFDTAGIEKAGMDASILPDVVDTIACVGQTSAGIGVFTPLGDNQASFLGSVRSVRSSLLINIGTGGQISCHTPNCVFTPESEARPYDGGSFLWVGSPLCGGRAYAVLESFFRQVAQGAGVKNQSMYPWMNELAQRAFVLENPLRINTAFDGSRSNPKLRGAIENLGIANFTPEHFIAGVLSGVVDEMMRLYEAAKPQLGITPDRLVVSGNGLRKNPVWRRLFSEQFELPVSMPAHNEEAAFGAALSALVGIGDYSGIEDAQQLIQYIDG